MAAGIPSLQCQQRFGNGYGTGRRGDPPHEIAVADDGTVYSFVSGNGYSGVIELASDGSSMTSLQKDAVGASLHGQWFSVAAAQFDNALVSDHSRPVGIRPWSRKSRIPRSAGPEDGTAFPAQRM